LIKFYNNILYMNLLARLKKENSNYYIFLLMVVLPIWVSSINAIIAYLLPKRTPFNIAFVAAIPIIFLLADDGKLDEFYKYESDTPNTLNKIGIMGAYDASSK
jgi:hypothetical protein